MKRGLQIAALVSLTSAVAIALAFAAANAAWSHERTPIPRLPFEAILDGDTIVDKGRAIHIRGLDSPELGPWAKCWAEAALAGVAKNVLEQKLMEDRGWRLAGLQTDVSGRLVGSIIDREGFDVADDMRVYGQSAMTDGKWNWCGSDANLHNPTVDEEPPMGPSLWWPSGHIYDERAAD